MAAARVQVLQLLLPGTPVKKKGVCHEILELCSPAFKPTPPKNKAAFKRRDRKRANAHKQQLQAKANFFNKSGFAKNLDYVMQVDNPTRRADTVVKHTGRGGWKKLTVECILKTASTPPTTSSRSGTPYNSGSNTYIQCVKINALAILLGQLDGIKKICRLPKLAFYITNNMCDETKLPMGWPRTLRRSVLAWHSQATWCEDSTHLVSGLALMPRDRFCPSTCDLKVIYSSYIVGLDGESRGQRRVLPRRRFEARCILLWFSSGVGYACSKCVGVQIPRRVLAGEPFPHGFVLHPTSHWEYMRGGV